jgi:hypothetical protein
MEMVPVCVIESEKNLYDGGDENNYTGKVTSTALRCRRVWRRSHNMEREKVGEN